jgi:predicted HAD superfamily hydrolase
MKTLDRSTTTAWRLLSGGVKSISSRGAWRSRLQAIESADVASFDIFGTLLLKAPDLDRDVFVAVSRWILANPERLGVEDLPDEATVRAGLDRVRRELMQQAVAHGNDPEISRRELYEAFFQTFAASPQSNSIVEDLLRYELQLHYELTALNPEILQLIQLCKSSRKRVIAISDTYFGANELASLLRMHGFEGFDAIYSSCDVGYSKFRGGLFEYVLAQEKVPTDRVLHIGDNRIADAY